MADSGDDDLWRSTVAEPTTHGSLGKGPRLPLRAQCPAGHHVALRRLYVVDDAGDELWRSTVTDPTTTAHFGKVLDFPFRA